MYLDNSNLIVDEVHGGSSVFCNHNYWDYSITSFNNVSMSVNFSNGKTGIIRFEGVDYASISNDIGGKHTVELCCDGFTLTVLDDNQLTEKDFEGIDELL